MGRPDAAATAPALALALVVAIAPALTACTPVVDDPSTPSGTPSPLSSPPMTARTSAPLPPTPQTVAEDLRAPWSLVFVGDSALVSERDSGLVREITADGDVREVALIDGVRHGGEGGLLGLAVRGGELFAYSTGADGNRVERYPLEGEPGALELGAPATVIDGLPSANVHNAGRIAFGPDGKLYVPVGDAGDPLAAQDSEALGGKILRLEPDGSVPADNPTPGSPVYSLGHRNVQGLAWDADGRLFASEFGQNTWDELNVIEPGGNYGWPVVEGEAGQAGFIDPIAQWATSEASPSGIAIASGSVLMANLRGEVLRAVSLGDPSVQRESYPGEYGRLRDVVVAPDGAVWVVTNNTDGRGDPRDGDDRILRVDPAAVAAGG